ncbi:regulator of volume decrease after cellular swelling-domain-containing protein [Cantharellus anzutake]|uniref:regulator of volume decrease after cellular swelling-domain-containing protein n=1 Tax=Cantharellus anzutake TaxID=1750568 RepID=UPI00190373A9|nr:regulator of volume decrease after cellular swelling-domain-containing protein [Cantharellus anzutake]KAF8340012.1 regulator of volume decrease after cellular swelling-domain-containing protein [Cantharellus anzutake]
MKTVQLISETPKSISLDEHRQLVESTPSSFGDIPPVLRHRQDGVKIIFDPPQEGLSEEDLSNGALYLVESVLAFISATGRGFQILYPQIIIHAISTSGSEPIVWCQLEKSTLDDDFEDGDDIETIELKIIPSDPHTVTTVFEALSHCSSLHPDPNSEGEGYEYDDTEEDDAVYVNTGDHRAFTGEDGEELSEAGRVRSNFANNNRFTPY